jgi:hypothetical protein
MKTPLQILNDVQIASPCTASWEEMSGDPYARHCAQCNKNVFDLSQLSAHQAINLLREKEGRLCIRLYRRHDGTVLTADCPVGLRERSRRIFRWAAALVASVFTFGLVAGCETTGPSSSKTQLQSTTASGTPCGDRAFNMGTPAFVDPNKKGDDPKAPASQASSTNKGTQPAQPQTSDR